MYDPDILVQYEDIQYSDEETKRVGKLQLIKDQPQHILNEYVLPLDISESSFENFKPNQGGYEEYFKIRLDKFNQDTISIRMRAIDLNGNAGRWSHILTIKVNNNTNQTLSPKLKHYHRQLRFDEEISSKKLLAFKEKFYFVYLFLLYLKHLKIIIIFWSKNLKI